MNDCFEKKRVFHTKENIEGYIDERIIGKGSNGDDWIYVIFDSESKRRPFLFPTAFKKESGALRFLEENDQRMVDELLQQKADEARLKEEVEHREREAREKVVLEQKEKAEEEEKNNRLKRYKVPKGLNEERYFPIEEPIVKSFENLREAYFAGEYYPCQDYPSQYDQRFDQDKYILRYLYAYTYEYCKMFESFLSQWTSREEIRMLSIGCGAMLDAWAIQEALRIRKTPYISVRYQGVDICKWNYEIQTNGAIINKESLYLKGAGHFFRDLDVLSFDVYCFPKAIGDIAGKNRQSPEYTQILKAFKTKPINKNELYIIASMIKYENQQMSEDILLIDKIKQILEERGFYCNNSTRWDGISQSIITSGCGMTYPLEMEVAAILAGQNPTLLRKKESYVIYRFIRGGVR